MNSQKQRGFTIIELMLFLGITGALFAALMIGVNVNINQQHYRESVASYKTLLEGQYSEVINPRSYRKENDNWICSAANGIESVSDPQTLGTSDCVLLGRYIQIEDGGKQIETGDVVGIEPLGASGTVGDLATLVSYAPRRSQVNTSRHEVEWQSMLQTYDSGAATASYMILRAPTSGLLRVFGSGSALPANLSDMITDATANSRIEMCVMGDGNVGLPTQAVGINAAIAGPNGVYVKTIDKGDTQC